MNIEIGSYEAQTRLPELLRNIQTGLRYTITLRGEAVADLTPTQSHKKTDAETAVAQMKKFMQEAPMKEVDIQALIREGRA